MEEWKDGRMERWKNGWKNERKPRRETEWIDGRMEGRKNGKMEDCGRFEL